MSCPSFAGRIFGHKFRPRFSEGASTLQSMRGCSAIEAAEFVRSTKPLTYHHDVCERCGAILDAPAHPGEGAKGEKDE